MRYFCESLSAHLINYLLIIINNKLTDDSVEYHASCCCGPLMRDPSDAHHKKSDGSGAI